MTLSSASQKLTVTYRGQRFVLAFFCRQGGGDQVLFLHGLGCSKADFEGAVDVPELASYTLLALDFPGMGGSPYAAGSGLTLTDLALLAHQFLLAIGEGRAHLVGHSMGGAVATLLAASNPRRVSSLVNVEGNLFPEDCFYSRQICLEVERRRSGLQDREEVLRMFLNQLETKASNRDYARNWRQNVRSSEAIVDYSRSLVDLSDAGVLFRAFRDFQGPRLFVFGEEHAELSYLPKLAGLGIGTCSVPASEHYPHHTNPGYFYRALANWLPTARTKSGKDALL